MPRDYVIAMGGTGSRCLEAIIYLAAAGLFDRNDLQVLVIDPDQNNGNSKSVTELIGLYQQLSGVKQPEQAKNASPALFKRRVNPEGQRVFWHNPCPANRTFRDAIRYGELGQNAKDFVSLFYSPQDLDMELDVGYRGRTSIGAAAMSRDLEASAADERYGLRPFVERLRVDAPQEPPPRIFTAGSVFGGTGATGLPTVPRLIKRLVNPPDRPGTRNNLGDNVRFGCGMMTPYFTFPAPDLRAKVAGPAPDATLHPLATKAVLIHYAQEHPPYQHIYLIGTPQRKQTNDHHFAGGADQNNSPHFAELVAASAAWDFFCLETVDPSVSRLHFANSIAKDDEGKEQDKGVGWSTLPAHYGEHDPNNARRNPSVLKQRLLAFTTFAYFYKMFLYPAIQSNKHRSAIFYRINFQGLSIKPDDEFAAKLNRFCERYLNWLAQLGIAITESRAEPPGNDNPDRLFTFEAFQAPSLVAKAGFLGRLIPNPTPPTGIDAYNRLLGDLNGQRLGNRGPESAVGLMIYLVHNAVWKFCEGIYQERFKEPQS